MKQGTLLIGALLLAALATVLWGRRMLLETIDRRFFREHYDARRILLTLASGSGHARNLPELATLVTAEVDRALHLQHVGLSIQDPEGSVLRDPQQQLPPLSTDSPLAALLAGGVLLLARAARLGFLANFLSRSVLVGFLTGVGIQVAAGQLPGMLGVPAAGRPTLPRLWDTLRALPDARAADVALPRGRLRFPRDDDVLTASVSLRGQNLTSF